VQILDGVAVSERVPLAPDAIEKDLLDLGYPSTDLEPLFSGLREREQDRQRRRAEECR
jgi:hypothetical protein